jgi:hypothetical protein
MKNNCDELFIAELLKGELRKDAWKALSKVGSKVGQARRRNRKYVVLTIEEASLVHQALNQLKKHEYKHSYRKL